MQKIFFTIIVVAFLFGSCHSAKQAQKVVKADTVKTQSPGVTLKPVDSTAILKEQLADVLKMPLNFTTFYGKAKANFSSPQASGTVTVYIKMQKDSIIWISVTGPLNIEGARVLITPDSVKIINKLEGSVQLSSIAHLQQITKLPLNFYDFQNIILGKPVINDSNALNYQIKKDSVTVIATSALFTFMYNFTKKDFALGQSNIQTTNNNMAAGANIFYNDYQNVNNIKFSTSRDISIIGSAPANIQLNFKEFNFNQPQNFVFTISKNYTIKYD